MIEINFGTIRLFFDGQIWWLSQLDGEGMGVSLTELDILLQDYYNGNF